MSVWQLVLLVPSAVVLGVVVLGLTAWLEHQVLSPRYLITQAVRVHNTPDHAERLVAMQARQLLSEHRLDRRDR